MTEAFENHESPELKPLKPDLNPRVPTPPPFAHQGQSPGSDCTKDAEKDPLHSKHSRVLKFGQSEATAALLQAIAPYNTELARCERENPLPVHSSSVDDSYSRPRGWKAIRPNRPLEEPFNSGATKRGALAETAGEVLDLMKSPVIKPPRQPFGDRSQLPPFKDLVDVPEETKSSSNSYSDTERTQSTLSKFLISDPKSRNSLPALRDPSIARPPEDAGTRLPPIQTQLSQLAPVLPPPPNGPPARILGTSSYSLPPVTAVSPPLTRADPGPWEHHRLAPLVPPKVPPSPYSHLSPASSQAISAVSSPVSQQTYWRGGPKPTVPYPFDPPSTSSRSPASNYPTPTEHTPPGACEPANFASCSQATVPPAPAGTFKCSHPGCTAPPFQTQYLLNSHANVHSQDRPHFCPVEGCSRGPGGKGFKRKNEMIRHGLVHNSPGYVCPFCPDQQHKYPRPDNLQRHVRVHHVDKSKDDPALRLVLAQRPEGSGRGRRRRINSQ